MAAHLQHIRISEDLPHHSNTHSLHVKLTFAIDTGFNTSLRQGLRSERTLLTQSQP